MNIKETRDMSEHDRVMEEIWDLMEAAGRKAGRNGNDGEAEEAHHEHRDRRAFLHR